MMDLSVKCCQSMNLKYFFRKYYEWFKMNKKIIFVD